MNDVTLSTLSMDLIAARAVNQTSSSFVAKVPTAAEPSGDAGTATGASIIGLRHGGRSIPNAIILVPYGTGSDDATFSLRLIGWRKTPDNNTGLNLWVPLSLVELACTICTVAGVAGQVVTDAMNFCDTIVVTTGSSLSGEAPAENIVSPANNTIAHAMIDLKGCTKFELSFSTGSSATDCNCLFALL